MTPSISFNKEGPLLMLSKQQTNTSSHGTQQTSLSVNSQKFKWKREWRLKASIAARREDASSVS
ncbi:hypothetical protein NC651_018085 [Populus alba x Populus x berolinensis]|nr:hypothetical protein NC651_018085 [Populus alba x Populus x berolinensis]